jgi:hypothetical protein
MTELVPGQTTNSSTTTAAATSSSTPPTSTASSPSKKPQQSSHHKRRSTMSAISDKMQHLKDKLHHTKLHDVKVELIHKKHQVGKFGNLFNRAHRHDEEHEKACDDKRAKIGESHRFASYFPERDGNIVKCTPSTRCTGCVPRARRATATSGSCATRTTTCLRTRPT